MEQLNEDRSDVVAHLKRNLEGKIEEARELSERLLALEELRKQEQAEYKKKESAMELEYRTMESNLSAEVKLAGKIRTYIVEYEHMEKFSIRFAFSREAERFRRLEISPFGFDAQVRGSRGTNRETGGVPQDDALRNREISHYCKG